MMPVEPNTQNTADVGQMYRTRGSRTSGSACVQRISIFLGSMTSLLPSGTDSETVTNGPEEGMPCVEEGQSRIRSELKKSENLIPSLVAYVAEVLERYALEPLRKAAPRIAMQYDLAALILLPGDMGRPDLYDADDPLPRPIIEHPVHHRETHALAHIRHTFENLLHRHYLIHGALL